MSAASIAAFAMSPQGDIYRSVCEHWGVDPGAPLEPVDDVLAFNLRAALLVTKPVPKPEPVDDRPGVVTDLEEQMRRMGIPT